jgi:hypothetical protein
MREVKVVITVSDEDYAETVANVTAQLLTTHPWIPGYIFRKAKGWRIQLDTTRQGDRR